MPKPNPQTLPPDRFINREQAWVEFNDRVLAQAADDSLPVLQRAKFLAITGSNLDEFIMVRYGGLRWQLEKNPAVRDPAGMTVPEQLAAVSAAAHRHVTDQYRLLRDEVEPQLLENRIRRVNLRTASAAVLAAAERYLQGEVLPVISPQALRDRQFPTIPGLGLHLCVQLKPGRALGGGDAESQESEQESDEVEFAVIPLGRALPRVVPLPVDREHAESDGDEPDVRSRFAYVLLEDLIAESIDDFFPGRDIIDCTPFRVTRNADIELREDSAGDLLGGMEEVLESRRQSRVVRLELDSTAGEATRQYLAASFRVQPEDIFDIDGPLDLTYLFSLVGLTGFDHLRVDEWPPLGSVMIDPKESMFASIAAGDIMLLHPFESFDPVVRLIEEAAADPDVLAIKQILYRTSRNSPIVAALIKAAERGKYVTAIVELKARFDEARNIEWAREMEQSGVQVIYGIRHLKTHAKICVVVRREPHGIVRYVHFGTGNYNEVTAAIYADVSLLTCDDTFGADATMFFNAVTGVSQPQPLQRLSIAPLTLRHRLLELIDGETQRSRQGSRGRIVAKLNALVDTTIIDALYRASQAGVKIQLNIRGICCLRPGVPGMSETIEVISIVDRFLEHARLIYFRHGGDPEIFLSSADWMPRNLDRRVELLVPVVDPALQGRLRDMLRLYFRDNQSSWRMQPDGSYEPIRPRDGQKPLRIQELLYNRTAAEVARNRSGLRSTFEPAVGQTVS